MPEQWGEFELTLEQYLRVHHVDPTRLAQQASIQRSQLNLYLQGEIKRPDLHVLARICTVLECGIGDILRFIPPSLAYPDSCCRQQNSYTTGQLAKMAAVHPNTIRFYERCGLLSKAGRGPNGYRQFSVRHLAQLRVCRIILGDPYTNKSLRSAAFRIVEALREWDIPKAQELAETYKQLLEKEYAVALETAALLKSWAEGTSLPVPGEGCSHKEAAALLGVTVEVVRNWERNGLTAPPRSGGHRKRVYGGGDMARLRVIYMLRQNNYSIAAIRSSLAAFDSGNRAGAVLALNQPVLDPESEYISAGDHWLEVLETLSRSADKIRRIVQDLSN
ncbi:MAG: hypothetical protein K0Q90_3109 [Paenibacillaceae bacterium]|jgi:DNA-binding transcriptional MerR regulator/DNA-binding Xre family transcriptional regulator|nr:hypothetical protein [Paenibacillaceae bacterium]